jgi:hypothetical protein
MVVLPCSVDIWRVVRRDRLVKDAMEGSPRKARADPPAAARARRSGAIRIAGLKPTGRSLSLGNQASTRPMMRKYVAATDEAPPSGYGAISVRSNRPRGIYCNAQIVRPPRAWVVLRLSVHRKPKLQRIKANAADSLKWRRLIGIRLAAKHSHGVANVVLFHEPQPEAPGI